MSPDPLRVAIADDHTLFRRGLWALLASVPDMEVCAEAADGGQALRRVVETHPDVLLLDIRMPGETGLEMLPRIRRAAPDTAILMLTMVEPGPSVLLALSEGASGYVLKGAEQDELLQAIRAAARGQLLLGPDVAAAVTGRQQTGPWQAPLAQLSAREREVADLLAAGLPVERIARRLGLSIKSVRNHLAVIPRKLGVATRAEVIEVAKAAGLGREMN
ncbi:response regulator [Paeniglutamicibacter cryotolerans]|uniref:DNA-binding NarL/FixJ family response regulator n=1 Tax=Paeniglutamicibacter cryotolerans TaxID=670079 RepID=A0A839QP75_9MICC|nr:response regulator transcription factor [Paeniglutamicibacter cryotolerans]MBB2995796.1 DNA-binding NarL/FixJ family response regulator [Paeniglutamicibacter cryotolerans]